MQNRIAVISCLSDNHHKSLNSAQSEGSREKKVLIVRCNKFSSDYNCNITDSKPNECNELQRGLTSLISLRIPTAIPYRHWQHCNVQSVRVAGRVRRVGLMFHGQPPHLNFDELADSDKDESCGTPPGLTSSTRRGIRVPRTETATARNLRKDYTIKIAEPSDD